MLELGEMVQGAQYVTAQRARAVLRDRVRNAFAMHRLDGMHLDVARVGELEDADER